ncbi:MAG TPA: SoxR reducing system RseC family protein [Ignavibacteriaceae bacterium]|nr:SoxR reducing system RseC family protein [Ignavibacteriaceae bacterium]
MLEEEIIEEGIVNSVKNGMAEIFLTGSGYCESCTAKIVCRNVDSGKKSLTVDNNFGGKVGDKVRISVKGKRILQATFLLYGFPVFIILFGILAGMQIFNDELVASLMGLGAAGLFFFFVYFFYKNKKKQDIIRTEKI